VVALRQVVPHELLEQVTQVTLPENDEVVQALGPDTFYEAVLARNSFSTRLRGESTKWALGERTLTSVPILR
jgi:hypothetical protein